MAEFTKPLVLTSPPETGKRVKDAQTLLHGANAFKENFHPGTIDGVMGPQTAGAIHRAKWFLGYPRRHVNNSMGEVLYNYLKGNKKLPALYAWRRKVRLAAAKKVTASKVKAMEAALVDAANKVQEYPADSNMQKYGAWYGFNGVAWCCIAITYWLARAGNKNWQAGSFASYVGAVVDAARSGAHHLAITSAPEKGDLAVYANGEHIEFFIEWINQAEGVFKAVGGNTSSHDGSFNNGGEVAINTRYVHASNFPVTNFIRVGF